MGGKSVARSRNVFAAAARAEKLQQAAHPEELGFDVTRLERMTRTFQGYVDAGELPGAVVLIARHDKVAYLRAFGYQDREPKTAMALDSIFRIASMTKPIVTASAMMLVEEGKLNIAASVFQYLPEFKDVQVVVEKRDDNTGNTQLVLEPQRRPMTVQDLMRHTAGLVYAPPIGAGPIPEAYRDADVANRDETLAQMVTKLFSRFIDLAPTPAMGQGFGLELAVRTEAGQNPLPGSVGSFYWTGAFGTTFYIDPSKQMIIVMMIQVPLPKSPYFRQIVRSLAYQALMPAE